MAASLQDEYKRAAAAAAVAEVRDGMVLGLGSGSTAAHAVRLLGARVADGLRVVGIPTSEATAALARAAGVPLTDFAAHRRIDLAIDGADQIERGSLALVKGLGGALLREKLVASVSRRMIVVADESKLVERLGPATPLPVEVVAFGTPVVLERLAELGCTPVLRMAGARPFVSDGGNHIVDCGFAPIRDAPALERRLRAIVGVVETGLFLGLASEAMLAGPEGVRRLSR